MWRVWAVGLAAVAGVCVGEWRECVCTPLRPVPGPPWVLRVELEVWLDVWLEVRLEVWLEVGKVPGRVCCVDMVGGVVVEVVVFKLIIVVVNIVIGVKFQL